MERRGEKVALCAICVFSDGRQCLDPRVGKCHNPELFPLPVACAKSVVTKALPEKLLWHTSDYSRLSAQPQSDYIEVVDR